MSRLYVLATLLLALIYAALIASPAYAAAGRTPGTFAVSPSGASTYTIPIWAPPGPHSLQPNIALTYNSTQGNGYLGVGWSVSGLSSIYRCNQTYAQDGVPGSVTLTTRDVFCMDGKRLRLTAGTYGVAGSTYQTEVADFSNVTAYGAAGNGPAYFVVQGRDGRSYTYGNGGNSQVPAYGTSTAVSWQLNEVSDPAGNTMTIAYSTSNASGAVVPSAISWTPTAHGANTYAYTMTFTYGANVVQSSVYGYVAGTPVVNTNLLGSVAVAYNGTVVKNYVLTYETAPNTGRDRLYTVQECASSGTTNCLAPTTVTYQSGAQGVGSAMTLATSPTQGTYSAYDLNGDGITDFVWFNGTAWQVSFGTSSGYSTPINTGITTYATAVEDIDGSGTDSFLVPVNGYWTVYKWNGSGFAPTPVTAIVDQTTAGSFALADVNGDGLPDLITTGTNGYLYVRLNTSTGGSISFSSTATETTFGQTAYTSFYSSSGGTRRLDFYGAGQQDLLAVTRYPRVSLSVLHFNGATFVPVTINDSAVDMADYNDDGCTDVLGQSTLYISPCEGSIGATVALPGSAVAGIDWDSDGRRDILVANGSTLEVYKSIGLGFSSTPITTSIAYPEGSYTTIHNATGDGQDGLLFTGSASSIQYYLHNGAGQPPDLLSNVTDGYGNSVSPVYQSIAQTAGSWYFPYTDATYPYSNYIGPMYVVNWAFYSDPSGQTAAYQEYFFYSGAWMNLQGRGFAGFASSQVHDMRNNTWETWSYDRAFPYTGMLTGDTRTENNTPSTTIYQLSSSVACTIPDSTATCTSTSQRYFPYISNSTIQSYELGTVSSPTTRMVTSAATNYTYDGYGNPLTVDTTVTDEDVNSPYYGKSWTTNVTNTPDTGTGVGCTSLLSGSIVAYSSTYDTTSVTRTKSFIPDLPNCRYTQIVTEPSSSLYKVTEVLGYDNFGNVNSDTVTGINMTARQTTASWGATGQFPVSVTDASGAQSQYTYNYDYGLISGITDPNGAATSWQYLDGFARKTKEIRPDGTATTWNYSLCSGCDARARLQITQLQLDMGGNTINTTTYFGDMIDRAILRMDTSLSGAGVWGMNRTYDQLGRVAAESFPYANGGNSPGSESYSYDVLNRVTSDSRPISASNSTLQSTTYAYSGREIVVTDPLAHQTTIYNDVNGRRRETRDPAGYLIRLGYDAAGSLANVLDNESHTLWRGLYSYGVAPFLTYTTDVDLGAWYFYYDALGDRTSWTDAKGNSFAASYDALSRPVTRTEPDYFTQWTWGSSASLHNWGRLQGICTGSSGVCSSAAYSESETYDSIGRPQTKSIVIPSSGTYTYNVLYSATTGLLNSLTYPTTTSSYALQLQYGYQYGILQSVKDISDSPNVTLWQANATNAAGQITQETLANGLVTNRAFDAVTGLLSSIQTGAGGGAAVQNFGFLYDEMKNVSQRQDNNRGLTENFYYDADTRLSYSKLNGTQNLSLTYDINGNITSRSDVAAGATWTYDPVHVHAVTQAGSSTYTYAYDANGNATSRQGSSISWFSFNYPQAISAGSGSTAETVAFAYGPDRQRWEQMYTGNGTTETTYYVGRQLEVVSSGGVTDYRHYIYAGNEPVAVYSRKTSGTNTFSYLLSDHQASVATIANSSGAPIVNESFSAFGSRRNPTTWSGPASNSDLTTAAGITREGYTFQTALGLWMGLNHMNGRVEDSVLGRFLSPDPYIQNPGNTQFFNRYAYVLNNPLTFTDPSGFDCWDEGGDDGIAGSWGACPGFVEPYVPQPGEPATIYPYNPSGGSSAGNNGSPATPPQEPRRDPSKPNASPPESTCSGNCTQTVQTSQGSPTPCPNSSGQGVLIQIGFTDAHSGSTTVPNANHTFVIAADPATGAVYASRGGPGSGGAGPPGSGSFQLVGVSGPYNASFRDYGSVTGVQTVGYVNAPYSQVTALMDNFAAAVNNNALPYLGDTNNSNSYTGNLLGELGFWPPPTPAMTAPGYGQDYKPIPNLVCTTPTP